MGIYTATNLPHNIIIASKESCKVTITSFDSASKTHYSQTGNPSIFSTLLTQLFPPSKPLHVVFPSPSVLKNPPTKTIFPPLRKATKTSAAPPAKTMGSPGGLARAHLRPLGLLGRRWRRTRPHGGGAWSMGR